MDEHGFDFGAPKDRREARAFEPPPWERDQFDQLAKERAEQDAVNQVAAAIDAATAADGTTGAAREGEIAEPASPAAAPALDEGTTGEAPHRTVEDEQFEMMMMGLRAEEPPASAATWMVTMMSAIVLMAVGFVLVVWGFAQMARSHGVAMGVVSAGILILFGLGFGGTGAWLVFRTLRQRGVL